MWRNVRIKAIFYLHDVYVPTEFCEVKIKVAVQERTYPLCSKSVANSVKYNCLQFTLVYYNRPIYDAKRMEDAICGPPRALSSLWCWLVGVHAHQSTPQRRQSTWSVCLAVIASLIADFRPRARRYYKTHISRLSGTNFRATTLGRFHCTKAFS